MLFPNIVATCSGYTRALFAINTLEHKGPARSLASVMTTSTVIHIRLQTNIIPKHLLPRLNATDDTWDPTLRYQELTDYIVGAAFTRSGSFCEKRGFSRQHATEC